MSQRTWTQRALWEEVEKFTGEIHTGSGNTIALNFYDKMEDILCNDSHKVEFQRTLSPSQYNSFRIIQEWWNCCIEDDPWFRANKDREKVLAILDIYPILEQTSPLILQMFLGIGPIIPRVSTYRLQVWRLWQMEFDPADGEDQDIYEYRGFLQTQRERAAFHASVKRLCFPFHLKMDAGQRIQPQSKGKDVQRSSLQGIFNNIIGTCPEACPWLRFRRGRGTYPAYLWNIEEKRTVLVESLGHEPEYICISHTWGRWHNPAEPFALIQNVPWLVPRNSRFSVEELPEMLRTAFPVQYIWLDLFCIPQDRSELALLEISRQAKIFGTAKAVVAWLFDVNEWTGLLNVIEWLAVYCIVNRGDVEETLPNLPSEQRTEMVLDRDRPDGESTYTSIGWFTSLWTLQEACLRPDMLLCSRDFTILSVADNIPVTLDGLAALLNFATGYYHRSPYESLLNRERIPQHLEVGTIAEFEQFNAVGSIRRRRALEQLPKSVTGLQEVYDVFIMSGMNKLYSISPATIFYLGQHRQCTASRAEAIMSVVGATDWYSRYVAEHHSPPPETNLVLGFYPSDFLNEVTQRTGACFYATIASNLLNLEGVVDTADGAWKPLNISSGIGSLLPFTTAQTVLLPQEQDHSGWYGHPSVASWTIESDGKVLIPEAGVLASSVDNDAERGPDVQASILIPGVFTTTSENQISLYHWIRTFWDAETAPNYAVSLYQQTKKVQWGLILKSVGEKGTLVKIGTFLADTIKVEDVPTKKVDWIVL